MGWDKKGERLDHGTDRDTPLRGVPVVPCPTAAFMPHLTGHAIERYRERVEFISDEAIREKLSTPGIRAAIAFGVRIIRLGCGAQLVIEDRKVVTVLAAHQRPKKFGAGYRNRHWRRKRPNRRWERDDEL